METYMYEGVVTNIVPRSVGATVNIRGVNFYVPFEIEGVDRGDYVIIEYQLAGDGGKTKCVLDIVVKEKSMQKCLENLKSIFKNGQ